MLCPTCKTPNPEGANFCFNCGSPLAPKPVEGERKFATLLFADVVGSTSLAQRVDPEEWAEIMNGVFAFMNAAVTRYGGTVGRLMGDAVLAFFGAPVAHEDDAERAVRAALEIVRDAREYGGLLKQSHGSIFGTESGSPTEFDVRVGINTGLAVLTTVGDHSKTEYTAMGDSANVAAKLQSVARPGTVLIGAETRRLVSHLVDVKKVEREDKHGQTVTAYEVIGLKATPGRGRGLEGIASPLVGRGPEFRRLVDRLEALRAGAGAFIVVRGEAGMGKSRLVAELRARLEPDAPSPTRWFEGRGLSYTQAIGYYPWQQVLRGSLGAGEGDDATTVRERLQAVGARLGLGVEQRSLLELLLGVEAERAPGTVPHPDEDELAGQLAAALRDYLQALANEAPTVVVLDDLHWADSASIDLLLALTELSDHAPLLLLCLLRPDRSAASWALVERVRSATSAAAFEIALEPLDPSRAQELLDNLLRVEDLPEAAHALILRKAEGNPFFLEEVIRTLIDSEHLVERDGRWHVTGRIDEVSIPDTLVGVLGARIDRLPEDTRRVAQTAAVIGRTFGQRVLTEVCQAAPPDERIDEVDPHLGTLAREELVRERAPLPEREYIFKHALTQETAYDRLLLKRRKELHRRTAAVLEEHYRSRGDEFAPLLAYHYRRGEEWLPAGRYLLRAGGRALKLHARQEALEHFRDAMEALERLPDAPPDLWIEAVLGWIEVAMNLRHHEDPELRRGMLERLGRAVESARAIADKRLLTRTLVARGNVLTLSGFPGEAFPWLLEANDLATELGDERLFLLPFFIATESLVDDDPRAAVEQFARVIDLARKHGNRAIEAHSLASTANAHARLGEFPQAQKAIEEALELAPRSHSLIKQADVNLRAGSLYYEMGEVEKGLEYSQLGLQQALQIGGMECACAGYYYSGVGKVQVQRPEEALQDLSEAITLGKHMPMEGFVNMAGAEHARTRLAGGETGAIHELEEALRTARSANHPFSEAMISQLLGEAYGQLERFGEAERHLAAALDYYRRFDLKPSIARTLEPLARVYRALGRDAEAQRLQAEGERLREELRGLVARSVAPAPAAADSGGV